MLKRIQRLCIFFISLEDYNFCGKEVDRILKVRRKARGQLIIEPFFVPYVDQKIDHLLQEFCKSEADNINDQ